MRPMMGSCGVWQVIQDPTDRHDWASRRQTRVNPASNEVEYSWHQPNKTLGKDPQDRGGFFIGSLAGVSVLILRCHLNVELLWWSST